MKIFSKMSDTTLEYPVSNGVTHLLLGTAVVLGYLVFLTLTNPVVSQWFLNLLPNHALAAKLANSRTF